MRIDCPICKQVLLDVPPDHGPRPFCSERCKLLDLSNWFNETYRVPASGSEEPEPMN
jgi:endogenous inhibitor of DNA gyrase (YacG/DUF329 family)